MAEKKTNSADKQTELLSKLTNGQKTKSVEWKDNDNKKHTTKVTMKEPSTRTAMQMEDLLYGEDANSDMAEIFGMVMDDVIVKPRLGYAELNNQVPEKLAKKEVTYDTENGGKFKVVMKFPDFRTAINLVNSGQKANDAMNLTGSMDGIIDSVLKNEDGTKITWDDFDDPDKLHGTIMDVYKDAMQYLGSVVSRNGLMEILMAGFQLSEKQITRIK